MAKMDDRFSLSGKFFALVRLAENRPSRPVFPELEPNKLVERLALFIEKVKSTFTYLLNIFIWRLKKVYGERILLTSLSAIEKKISQLEQPKELLAELDWSNIESHLKDLINSPNIWEHSTDILKVTRLIHMRYWLDFLPEKSVKQKIGLAGEEASIPESRLTELGENSGIDFISYKKKLDDLRNKRVFLSKEVLAEVIDTTITDCKPKVLTTQLCRVRDRLRSDPFSALGAVSSYSSLGTTAWISGLAVICGAAYSIPRLNMFGVDVWKFWVLQDYVDNGLLFLPLLFFLVWLVGIALEKPYRDLIENTLGLLHGGATATDELKENITSFLTRRLRYRKRYYFIFLALVFLGLYFFLANILYPIAQALAFGFALMLLVLSTCFQVVMVRKRLQENNWSFVGGSSVDSSPDGLLTTTIASFVSMVAIAGMLSAVFLKVCYESRLGEKGDDYTMALFGNGAFIPNVELIELTSRTAFLLIPKEEAQNLDADASDESLRDTEAEEVAALTISVDRAEILCLDSRSACEHLIPQPQPQPQPEDAENKPSLRMTIAYLPNPTDPEGLLENMLETLWDCPNAEEVDWHSSRVYFASGSSEVACMVPFSSSDECTQENQWGPDKAVFRSGETYLVLGMASSTKEASFNLDLSDRRANHVRSRLLEQLNEGEQGVRIRAAALGEVYVSKADFEGKGFITSPDDSVDRLDDSNQPNARVARIYRCSTSG